MRTMQQIQSDVSATLSELGSLRGQYLHHELTLTTRLATLESELREAQQTETARTPAALEQRIAALEAALTKEA